MNRAENDLLRAAESWHERAQAEFTITRLMCWVLGWGILLLAALLMLHFG